MAADLAVTTLRSHLHRLAEGARSPHPDPRQPQGQFLLAQQQFQQQVSPLGEAYPNAQPLLTEMNRTLRLLAMDVAFLQAARQPSTAHQRQRQLLDKLEQLLGFCDALAAAIAPPDTPDP
jgi:hypothetical protein